MEQIFYKKKLVGVLLRRLEKGSVPVTDGKEPLQLVTLKHPKGAYLKAHMHKPKKRVTMRLQECLIMKKGSAKIDLYGADKKKFKTISLREGETYILMYGGYGIHVTEDAEMIEVKNGPFLEDKVLI